MAIKAAILGAQGYAGRDLARLLLKHPQIELSQVFSRNADWDLSHDLPELGDNHIQHQLWPASPEKLSEMCQDIDIIFLATPHEVSLECIPHLYDGKKKIIDLSGAFRIPASLFHEWYQQPHTAMELLEKAQFGLCPHVSDVPSLLIANPGCYATAILMALVPLAKNGLLSQQPIIIDAKSGISGAGRSAKSELLFGEIANNFFPYKIGQHQHTPEIQVSTKQLSGVDINIILNTQVLPIHRGISAAMYIPLEKNNDIEKIKKAYQDSYQHYSLVRHAHLAEINAKQKQQFLSLKNVVGSCRTHIGYQIVNSHLVIFSMIDNLLKGAASQAIENANRMLGLALTCGLEQSEGLL